MQNRPGLDRRIDALFARLGEWLVDRRALALAFAALVSLVAANEVRELRVVTANEYLFIEGDPLLVRYEAYQERFGSDEFVFIVLRADDIFRPEPLSMLGELADAIEERVPHVLRVTSLIDVESIDPDPEDPDGVIVQPFIDRDAIPSDPAELNALRERALARTEYTRLFVSADSTHTGVLVEISKGDSNAEGDFRRDVSRAVEAVLSEPAFARYAPRVAGTPILDTALNDTITADARALSGWSLALGLAVLIWMFRRVVDVVAPSLVIVPAILWVLGLMAFCDVPLTMLSMTIPALITAIGMGDAIHVIAEYRAHASEYGSTRDAIVSAIRKTGLPCLFTTLTTMVGFGSLMAMEIRPGREMGLFAAIGVLIALILTFLVLPPVLSFGSISRIRHSTRGSSAVFQRAVLGWVAEIPIRWPWRVLAACALIGIASFYGISQVRVDAHFLRMFDPDTQVRKDFEYIEDHLGGTASLEVVVETDEPGGLLEPEVLADVAALSDWLAAYPEVRSVQSYLDPIQDLNQVMRGNDPVYHRPPESRALAAQLFLIYEMGGGQDVERFITSDRDAARVTARLPQLATSEYMEVERDVLEWAERNMKHARVTVNGEVPLLSGLFHRIAMSQLKSFGLAFVAITLMMIVLFRSLRFGLTAMVPNVAPVLVTLGFMGLVDITLNLGTMLIASIAIGIAVDDTIHFVSHYRRHRDEGMDVNDSLRATVLGVGQAMLSTSLVLTGCFSVFVLSNFAHLENFGLLTALTVMLALAADFLLLPALLVVLEPRFRITPKARPALLMVLVLVLAGLACSAPEEGAALPDATESAWQTLALDGSEAEIDGFLEGLAAVIMDPPPTVGEDYEPSFPPDLPFDAGEWTKHPPPPSVANPDAPRGGTLRLALGSFPPTLRTEGPNSRLSTLSDIHNLVYEPLLGYDVEAGRHVPGLAEHWQVGEDQRSFRFRLNEQARWADGRAVTADDVAATFEHLMNPDRKDPAIAQHMSELVESVTVLDRLTVQIVAHEARWRSMISISGVFIYPAAYIRMDGETYLTDWNWKLPPGSGPYGVHEVKKGRSIEMRRRNDYWDDENPANRGVYNFGGIVWSVIRDPELTYQKFLADELDLYVVGRAQRWVDEVDRELPIQQGWIQKRRIFNQNPEGYGGYAFNMRLSPFDNRHVRAAFASLFNREKLFEKFFFYQYDYTDSYFPGQIWARPDATRTHFDATEARRLLAEAGWTERNAEGQLVNASGERFPKIRIDFAQSGWERIHSVLKDDLWQQAGIELELKLVDGATLLKNVWDQKFQLVFFAWTAGLFPDPEFQFHSKYADSPQTNNINGYRNDEVDAILEAYKTEFDPAVRRAQMQRLDTLLFDDHLYALGWYAPYFRILYWDRFGHPEEYAARFERDVNSVLRYWWFEPDREASMLAAKAEGESAYPGRPLGQADDVDQVYWRSHRLPMKADRPT